MVLLQPKLNLRVSQKQILTPGLVQMGSVLALNKIELKDMINAEIVENPVLEELDSSVPLIDDIASREEERDRVAAADEPITKAEKADPFDEIDFGSFFQDYLDPGYRSHGDFESVEKPSFENFLSRPSTLTDHLMWQLGSLPVRDQVRAAAELIIGNLNEDGYLIATDEELLAAAQGSGARPANAAPGPSVSGNGTSPNYSGASYSGNGVASESPSPVDIVDFSSERLTSAEEYATDDASFRPTGLHPADEIQDDVQLRPENISTVLGNLAANVSPDATSENGSLAEHGNLGRASFELADLHEAIDLVRQMDPVGVASRDIRECLLVQLKYHQQLDHQHKNGDATIMSELLADCVAIIGDHLKEVQNKQHKEIARAIGRPLEAVMQAMEFIKTLDPRPGQRYNKSEPRLIEPDVAIVKHGDEYVVVMNEDDIPQLRLNPAYKRLLHRDAAEKDVRNYVKERYKSAIQLIKNIEQRKQTILKVCYAIIGRQRDFLDKGIDQLKPMMIKEVAEEIGVHPSTVSRAVASKYAHTPQGVFELRYFFSESVNGPEGGGTSLLILKRRVKKLIEEENPAKPLTDDQITRILQSQGIQVTRRTVAKYREDMRIPSTHQRRVKN